MAALWIFSTQAPQWASLTAKLNTALLALKGHWPFDVIEAPFTPEQCPPVEASFEAPSVQWAPVFEAVPSALLEQEAPPAQAEVVRHRTPRAAVRIIA